MANTHVYCSIPNQTTTQKFGNGNPPHKGRDSVAKLGTVVYGSGDGRVTHVSRTDPTYGYRVEVTYLVGSAVIVVGDGHLSRIDVKVGDPVGLTTVLGLTGGKAGALGAGVSKAPHLHEDTRVNGVLTDPENVLADRETTPAGSGGTPITETDNDMRAIRNASGGIALVGETTYIPQTSDTWPGTQLIWGQAVQLTDAQFSIEIAQVQARRIYSNIGAAGGSPVDVAALAAAVEARLADEFKAIPDAVADELAGRLQS